MLEERYEVHTSWGWFRLDAETYKDYLAGKLWNLAYALKRDQAEYVL